ncbi:hypothetical protein ERJ75_000256100 [Trypanosoma vivax]|nr:hypothetical protein ERJ75_000256100 [Trypanosoma vivax]
MVPFESVRSGNFTRAFEATRGCFGMNGAGWRRAGPRSSSSAKRHGREFTKNAKNMQAQFASADGENDGLEQRTCQLEGQNRQMLGHAKSLQGADGVLATANGHPKAGRFRKAMEMRGLGAQRAEPAAAQVGGNGFSCAHSR